MMTGLAGEGSSNLTDLDAFVTEIDLAQEEFARGMPDRFKALWLHDNNVTLSGGHGGVIESGWDRVADRLDWASSTYQAGERSNEVVSVHVADDIAYLVRKEVIEAEIGGGDKRSRQELRVTMVFRRGIDGWRIVHRHADSQTVAALPR